ncbi:MAG TPA: GAF domain-containing sensor histidine kinase [Chloroflexota bacterium]|nr:GAF domain-containing sensor histidine kinase [Chloroflexota bacterium]
MSAADLVQFLSQALYALVFVAVLVGAIQRPRRVAWDVAAFFGAITLIVAETWVFEAAGVKPPLAVNDAAGVLLLGLPYILLRLLDDFGQCASWILRLAEVVLGLAILGLVATGPNVPGWMAGVMILYFVALTAFCAVSFFMSALAAKSFNRRRRLAVACGIALLAAALAVDGVATATDASTASDLSLVSEVLSFATGIAFLMGFAPPRWLRQAWQAPELEAFLRQTVSFASTEDDTAVVTNLEQQASTALGVGQVWVGLWDDAQGALHYATDGALVLPEKEAQALITAADAAATPTLARQAYEEQRTVFAGDVAKADPDHAGRYRAYGIRTLMAAPVTAAGRPIGVMVAAASQALLFAEDNLRMLTLLADQTAMVLHTRSLLRETASAKARYELDELKDQFLSAAAHDLKTPLTSIRGLAQMIQRRLTRENIDPQTIDREASLIVESTARMASLVDELLDVSRMEAKQGFELRPSVADIVAIVRRSIDQRARMAPNHEVVLDATQPELSGFWDAERLERVFINLIDNAIKYSPAGGIVNVIVRPEDRHGVAGVYAAVSDHGIGIPAADLPRIFERFQRAGNASGSKIQGTGIGLSYVRNIVEQHGGVVAASSREGEGATFSLWLPQQPDGLGAA